ncbi:MFS transporter [Paenibacillus sp. GD4]|uniref:MFS transporter n=1 Tax=Paenibacillus sp. GD4 TaxID=3068890 RepID=UPI002796CBB5|nr:MFS transporter [Paenibacillus sp. GD4]MDQ1911078.1 MFS transporter [Paenibacillus sp. GD4]
MNTALSGQASRETAGLGFLSRPLLAMYIDTLLMAIGFFMLVPLLGVHLMHELGWSAASAGVVMAISGFAQQGFKFFSGIFADRIGYKRAILIGVAVRIAGYALYGMVSHPVTFALAGFISGLAGAIFHPASYAAYARLSSDSMKQRIFGLREMLSNVGFILGPVIGMLLMKLSFAFVCFASAMMFAAAFFISWRFLPDMKGEHKPAPILATCRKLLQDKTFLLFNVFAMGLWALQVQLYLAVPVRAGELLPDAGMVAYLYMSGAIFMVLLQLPLVKMLQDKLRPSRIMAYGAVMLGLGLLAIGFSQGLWTLLLAILLFTLGQMVTMPFMNQMISGFADKQLFATYFGFNGIALAVGGMLGNTTSGALYDYAQAHPSLQWLPWAALCAFGVTLALLLIRLGGRFDPPPAET